MGIENDDDTRKGRLTNRVGRGNERFRTEYYVPFLTVLGQSLFFRYLAALSLPQPPRQRGRIGAVSSRVNGIGRKGFGTSTSAVPYGEIDLLRYAVTSCQMLGMSQTSSST